MTVSTTASTTGPLAGDGSNASWPFSFPVQDASQVRVVRRGTDGTETVVSSSSYGLALVNDGRSGGTVTYPLGSMRVGVGEYVTVRRSMNFLQPTNLRNQGSLAPETLETSTDRGTMQDLELRETVLRSVRISETEAGPLPTLPVAATRAGKYLYFDNDGNPTAVSSVSTGVTAATAWARTLLDDANVLAARSTLGLGRAFLQRTKIASPVTSWEVTGLAASGYDTWVIEWDAIALASGHSMYLQLGGLDHPGYWQTDSVYEYLFWRAHATGTLQGVTTFTGCRVSDQDDVSFIAAGSCFVGRGQGVGVGLMHGILADAGSDHPTHGLMRALTYGRAPLDGWIDGIKLASSADAIIDGRISVYGVK